MDTNTKSQRRKKKMPVWAKILLILLIVMALIAGGAYGYVRYTLSKMHRVDPKQEAKIAPNEEFFEVDESLPSETEVPHLNPDEIVWANADPDVMKDRDVVNILLIGQDRREGEGRQRSDSMILATINKKSQSIYLTSFMRDMYVPIPGYSDNRINAAYAFGGMDLLDDTIETNFGIHIDGNVEVDFSGFKTLIDMMGGIDLYLSQAEADYICGRNRNVLYPQAERPDWDLSEGMNHLTGEQALIHARNRSIGNSDYRRTERQREVLISAFTAMKSSDPITLVALINEAMPLLTTDMESSQILGYAMEILTMGVDDVQSFRIPANGMYSSAVIRKMQVLGPDLNQCRAYLREILYGEAG